MNLLKLRAEFNAIEVFRTIPLNALNGGTMKPTLCIIGSTILLVMSSTTYAAQGLTPQECHDYPFVQPRGEVTHAQLMQELSELEAVGYRPAPADPYYPRRIERAERKLRAEYRQDCMPAANNAGSTTG